MWLSLSESSLGPFITSHERRIHKFASIPTVPMQFRKQNESVVGLNAETQSESAPKTSSRFLRVWGMFKKWLFRFS